MSGVRGALMQRRHVAYYFRPVVGSDESARGLILCSLHYIPLEASK